MSEYGSTAPDANLSVQSFRLEIDGIQVAAFDMVELGGRTWGGSEHRQGIDPLVKQESSSIQNRSTIKLTKKMRDGGMEDLLALDQWYQAGSTDRRSGAVAFIDRDGNEVLRASFQGAWVKECDAVSIDPTSDEAIPFVFTLSVPTYTFSR